MSQKIEKPESENPFQKTASHAENQIGEFRVIGKDKVSVVTAEEFDKFVKESTGWINTAKDLFDYHTTQKFSEGLALDSDAKEYLYNLVNDKRRTENFLTSMIRTMSKSDFFSRSNYGDENIPSMITRAMLESLNRESETRYDSYSYVNGGLVEAIYTNKLGPYAVTSCNFMRMIATTAAMLQAILRSAGKCYTGDFYELSLPVIEGSRKTVNAMRAFARTILHFYRIREIDPALFESTYADLVAALNNEVWVTVAYIREVGDKIIKDKIMEESKLTFDCVLAMVQNPYDKNSEPPF